MKPKTYQRKRFSSLRKNALKYSEKKIVLEVENTLMNLYRIGKIKGYIGIYWPLDGEVDLRKLNLNFRHKFALPYAKKDGTISYHSWDNNQKVKKDDYGIPAPDQEISLNPKSICLMLVPAIAIDTFGYRIGYGKGFFDRLRSIPKWRSITSICVLPEICVSSKALPRDSWDIPFDGWITECGNTMTYD